MRVVRMLHGAGQALSSVVPPGPDTMHGCAVRRTRMAVVSAWGPAMRSFGVVLAMDISCKSASGGRYDGVVVLTFSSAMLPPSEDSDSGNTGQPVETETTVRSASPMPFPSLQTRHCPRSHTLLYRSILGMSLHQVPLHPSLFR
jgi:hypothetical protein